MKKSELRSIIREVLQEELKLHESADSRAIILLGARHAEIDDTLQKDVRSRVPETYSTLVFDPQTFAKEFEYGRFMAEITFYADKEGMEDLKDNFEGTPTGARLIPEVKELPEDIFGTRPDLEDFEDDGSDDDIFGLPYAD